MARRLSQSISKSVYLSEVLQGSDRVMGRQESLSLMHVGIEGLLMWSDQTDKL